MTEDEFYTDYLNGRKDFRNADLKGIDFFTPELRRTHPEFFSEKISKLVHMNNPVIHRPINGVNLTNYDFERVSFLDTELLRVIFSETSLTEIDGRFASFLGVDLSEADFTGADLRFSVFFGTNITSTNFCHAKLDHATFEYSRIENSLFDSSSAVAIKIYRTELIDNHIRNSDFSNARLTFMKFIGCTFKDTSFSNALLSDILVSNSKSENCKFINTNMDRVFFKKHTSINSKYDSSRIHEASISNSSFSSDSFNGSVLVNSKLIQCRYGNNDFSGASLQSVHLEKSIFLYPSFGNTSFNNVDLSYFLHSNARHYGSSSIDQNSIANTIMKEKSHPFDLYSHADLQNFVQSCGMDPIVAIYLIDSIRALNKNQLREIMSSTFISYGTPDEKFARKLNEDLTKNGITTFFFPLDATFGEKLYSTMHRINDYDRTILLCSSQSLDRPGLLYELEKTLEREAREGGKSYLIPIALDDYVFNGWNPVRQNLRTEILNRVVADFTDMNNYSSQFQRLLRSLKKLNV